MDELLKQLPTLGIGGIIAGIVLYWKRQDDLRYQNEAKTREKEIKAEQRREVARSDKLLQVVEANTKAMATVAQQLQDRNTLAQIERRLNESMQKANRGRKKKQA